MRKKRIVIVEDQPIVALDFQNFLKSNGYNNVAYFVKGKEAINNFKENKPDLVLLDIKLRDNISGLQLAEFLSSFNVPYFFVSAFSNEENFKKAVRLNPVKIFHKPIDHQSLLNAINEFLSSDK